VHPGALGDVRSSPVTYFPDLSPYSYRRPSPNALNVGWLDAGHRFETVEPAEETLDALWHFIKAPVVKARGGHECELCPRDSDFLDRVRAVQARWRDPEDPLHLVGFGYIPWPEDMRSRSTIARRGDEELTIGSAEMRVFGEHGAIYAAPTLIYHYVLEHQYKPPDEFVRALLTGPRPPSDEYRALLQRLDLKSY
jgi:hypothetical protein